MLEPWRCRKGILFTGLPLRRIPNEAATLSSTFLRIASALDHKEHDSIFKVQYSPEFLGAARRS